MTSRSCSGTRSVSSTDPLPPRLSLRLSRLSCRQRTRLPLHITYQLTELVSPHPLSQESCRPFCRRSHTSTRSSRLPPSRPTRQTGSATPSPYSNASHHMQRQDLFSSTVRSSSPWTSFRDSKLTPSPSCFRLAPTPLSPHPPVPVPFPQHHQQNTTIRIPPTHQSGCDRCARQAERQL